MKVLFYLQPRIELGDPFFRYATLRNSIVSQIAALHDAGVETHLTLGEAVHRRAIEHGLARRLGPCSVLVDRALRRVFPSYQTDARAWYRGTATDDQRLAMQRLLTEALPVGFVPDAILVWETPTPYLQALFPRALMLYQWPGFVSRPPFPELVTFDTGLLAESATAQVIAEHASRIGLAEAEALLQPLRGQVAAALEQLDPLDALLQRYRRQFERLILVPLQVDQYFTVTEVLREGQSQLDFLIELLQQAPEDVGVVVTQYVSRNVSSRVITPAVASYLRESHPNFLYDPFTDRVPHCSQFLVRKVDATVAVSSSVGLQAALWSKPLLAVGESHISPFSTARTTAELVDQLRVPSIDRSRELAALLPRQHPPMRALAERRGLLASCIEKLVRAQRSGDLAKGRWPELLPRHEYFDFLASSARVVDLNDELVRAKVSAPRVPDTYDAILRADVVCFDVFDTLLQRPFEHPTDLFAFMEDRARELLNLPGLDFVAARRSAERAAFEHNLTIGRGESTLDEIYQALADQLGVPRQRTSAVMQLEMELERDLLRPRKIGKSLYDFARLHGKRIVLISDMYLPEDLVAQALAESGYSGHERLYLSSTHRKKKQTGALFELVTSELDVAPSRIVHVGDNEKVDLARAQQAGMKALLLRRAMPYFRDTSAYRLLWSRDDKRHHRDWRSVLTLVAQGLYDDPAAEHRVRTLFSGRPRTLGYYGLGPLLLGFAKWLAESSIRDRKEVLFFLARDGLIMMRAYEAVAKCHSGAPEARYLLCSRRAVNVAKLRQLHDVMTLLDIDYARTTFEQLMTDRFGLTRTADLEARVAETGLSWDSVITADQRTLVKEAAARIADVILASAAEERAAYLEYLEREGVAGPNRAVVDVGYAGTMQESLAQLLGERAELDGYYLVTFRPALARQRKTRRFFKGYLAESIDRHDTWHPFCRHVPLYETLFSGPTTSFVSFTRTSEGALHPNFLPQPPGEERRLTFVQEVQDGAISFVEDAVRAFGPHLPAIDIEPFKSLRALHVLFSDPHPVDARMFHGVSFEDAYGGAKQRWLVPPPHRLASDACIWERGSEVLLRDALSRNGASNTKANHEHDWMVRAVNDVAGRVLSPRKSAKLKRNPERFFADAQNGVVRWLGRKYLARVRS